MGRDRLSNDNNNIIAILLLLYLLRYFAFYVLWFIYDFQNHLTYLKTKC